MTIAPATAAKPPHTWPFMACELHHGLRLESVLRSWTPTRGKSYMVQWCIDEYRAAAERRKREGQAAIALAVNTLLTHYQH